MHCLICHHDTHFLFQKQILKKYNISYFKCNHCGLVQTEPPYWLEEAYHSAITALDLGLIKRNIGYSAVATCCIELFFNKKRKFVDFAGGYGMLVRMMRDKGYHFYREEPFCENLFAKGFDTKDISTNEKFELMTAFEVMEHLENPTETLDKMLQYTDNILFSTSLYDGDKHDMQNWDYLSLETGQHIVFYTKKSLEILAKQKNLNFHSNGRDMHLFTTKKLPSFLFKLITYKILAKPIAMFSQIFTTSLLQKDVDFVKNKIQNIHS